MSRIPILAELDAAHIAAIKAFRAVVDNFEYRDGHIYMPEISAPTIPLPIFPYAGYRLTPRGNNWSYGLAAAIMALRLAGVDSVAWAPPVRI